MRTVSLCPQFGGFGRPGRQRLTEDALHEGQRGSNGGNDRGHLRGVVEIPGWKAFLDLACGALRAEIASILGMPSLALWRAFRTTLKSPDATLKQHGWSQRQ